MCDDRLMMSADDDDDDDDEQQFSKLGALYQESLVFTSHLLFLVCSSVSSSDWHTRTTNHKNHDALLASAATLSGGTAQRLSRAAPALPWPRGYYYRY